MKNKKNRPTVEEVKKIDLIKFLADLNFKPERIDQQDYWYLSPFSTDRTISFRINRVSNTWHDHSTGREGNIFAFAMLYYRCTPDEFLDSLAGQIELQPFQAQAHQKDIIALKEPQHSPTFIEKVRTSICDLSLINFLRQRRIPLHIADQYCKEIHYKIDGHIYCGLGIETDLGSYEILHPYATVINLPEAITTLNNGANNVCIFSSFIDFLTFLTIHPVQPDFPQDYVILNHLSLFEKAREFMESHLFIHLLLPMNALGKSYTRYALSISPRYEDHSKLYQGYKSLNDWLVEFGKRSG